jgi:hypothetical protein
MKGEGADFSPAASAAHGEESRMIGFERDWLETDSRDMT